MKSLGWDLVLFFEFRLRSVGDKGQNTCALNLRWVNYKGQVYSNLMCEVDDKGQNACVLNLR
jgi:hypothetical protein